MAADAVQGSGTDGYTLRGQRRPGQVAQPGDGINTWSVEQTETTGKGSPVQCVATTFSNFDGDALVTDTSSGGTASGTLHWYAFDWYDQYANVLESAALGGRQLRRQLLGAAA